MSQVRPLSARELLPVAPGLAFVLSSGILLTLGRRVCLVAQRIPVMVWVVRKVYRWKDARQERAARTSPS
ncbi:MAG: hypothetical protein ABIO67_09905 [Mycobacteriales bacterium]